MRIAITGGTGTFGQCCTKILLNEFAGLNEIRIISRGEFKQWEMQQEIKDPRVKFCIGDTRDKDRMIQLFKGIDLVIHAAALKHITFCEQQPMEAVKTEILGSQNVIDAAIINKVPFVMGISTDKACKPVNLYGATKMAMEKLFISANGDTKFSCCRYGNVIGSRGSLIDLIRRTTGKIPLTSPEMTRFWIRIDDGVRWVLKMISEMKGGEIFIPKMPSMKVIDVIKTLAHDREIDLIGVRPGEKLHEMLIAPEEHAKEYDDHYTIHPDNPCGIEFTSQNNKWWLTPEELKERI